MLKLNIPCAKLESFPELHPALVVQAVSVLNHVADEGGIFGLERIVEHARPAGRLEMVLSGRAGRPVKVAEGGKKTSNVQTSKIPWVSHSSPERGPHHGCHDAPLTGLGLALVACTAITVVTHPENVTQLVGDDEGAGQALFVNQRTASGRVADSRDRRVAGRTTDVTPSQPNPDVMTIFLGQRVPQSLVPPEAIKCVFI